MPPDDEPARASLETLRILVADDHPVVRQGLALMINTVPGWELCGSASNGDEAIQMALTLRPRVIVLDLHMPEFDGLAAIREIKRQLPETELVIFSGVRADTVVQELFNAGAKSFVGKTDDAQLLIAAIRSAAAHKPFITPGVSELLFRRFMQEPAATPAPGPRLTDRERQIIRHIAEGESNRDIATALGISSRTAETHRAAIMRKLGASSSADIIRYAIRHRIIDA